MSKLCVACIFTTPLWILAGMHWAVMLECKDCYLCNPSKQTVPFPTTDIVEWTLLSITICNCSVLVVSVVTELGLVLVMQNFLYALLLSTFAVNFVWLFCISGKKGNFGSGGHLSCWHEYLVMSVSPVAVCASHHSV